MQRRHHVQYDDGEDENLCLEREEWDFLDGDAHITKPEGALSLPTCNELCILTRAIYCRLVERILIAAGSPSAVGCSQAQPQIDQHCLASLSLLQCLWRTWQHIILQQASLFMHCPFGAASNFNTGPRDKVGVSGAACGLGESVAMQHGWT